MANILKFIISGDAKDGEKALDSINSKIESGTESFAKWGVAAGLAIAALSIKEATEFESKMAEVSTLLDDTSGLEGMEQAVKDLAIEYGQFPDDQVESIYSIISAGADSATEAVQTLEAANKLAIGGVTEVAIAADGLTSAMNAYGEEAGTATDVSDAMFVAMKAGKTTIGELSGSLGNVAPIAAEAGVGLDELLAATAALTKTGATTSVSMNGLRQIISSVLKPTAEAEKEAKRLGLSFNSAALESKGLQGFLADLEEKTGGNKDSMTQLFGSVEALGPIFALTGSQSEAFSSIMEQMNDKAGATEVAFGKIQETGGQAFSRLAALGNVATITLGNQLLPAVADFANFLIGPTTDGINRVEDAFFFLKAGAFAVLGGISEGLAVLLTGLSAIEKGLAFFSGAKSEDLIFTSLKSDLEFFAAAMEEGAIETFRARDAAEQHNIKLREQSNLLRGITEDIIVKKEVEATARVEKEELETTHQTVLTEIEKKGLEDRESQAEQARSQRVSGISQMFGDLGSALMAGNKEQFEAGKKFASVQALISTHEGAQKAFSSLAGIPIVGPGLGIAAATAATLAGLARVKMINSQSFQAHDGIDSFPGSGSFIGNMEKGEMIINKGNSEGIRKLAEDGLNGVGRGVSVVIENLIINPIGSNIDWESEVENRIKPAFDKLFKRDIFLNGVVYE